MKNSRRHLLEIYETALKSVQGESCVRESLNRLAQQGPFAVVAIGKAAASMMDGAVSALGKQIEGGLIITKTGHCGDQQKYQGCGVFIDIPCLEAGHPIPDENSLTAGKELLLFIDRQPASRTLVFLISGGASSLVESLPEEVSLVDLQKLNEWLQGSGLDIAAMNYLRSSISCLKGGRLAKIMGGRKVLSLMISDVPGDIPHVIGSGLLSATPLLSNKDLQKPLSEVLEFNTPKWVDRLINQLPKEQLQVPLPTDACFKTIDAHVIATLNDAKLAAVTAAEALGYDVILHEELVQGDAMVSGKEIAHELYNSRPAVHIWGGETTIHLPENPGRGGRNQHLALAAATVLDGHKDCWLLAAGTDGSDGPTTDAGALVDGETLARGLSVGLNAEKSLADADAGAFLVATDDLIRTGPTGTNVMDLVIGLKI